MSFSKRYLYTPEFSELFPKILELNEPFPKGTYFTLEFGELVPKRTYITVKLN